MAMNRKVGFALALILLGGLILLNKIGFLFGPILGYVVPVLMIVLGYYAIKNGSKLGWLIAILGAFILMAKLTPFIVGIMAVLMIGFGILLLTKRSNA